MASDSKFSCLAETEAFRAGVTGVKNGLGLPSLVPVDTIPQGTTEATRAAPMGTPTHAFARRIGLALALVFCASAPQGLLAQTTSVASTSGALRAYSTVHSIGVEWDLIGDDNRNAVVRVEYRIRGDATWSMALPLLRIAYNGTNMLAGSALFLKPGTAYELRLALSDPDGGAETRLVAISTRPTPVMPSARTFHVTTGTGGGTGTEQDPFRGIAAAQAVARPGDRFVLHAGAYGGRVQLTVAGTASQYVMWSAAGDGEVTFAGVDITASYIWLEGVTVRDQTNGLMSANAPSGVVVARCTFLNNHYSVYLRGGGEGWYIADNTIAGRQAPSSESFDGEGIELNHTAGHTVAHNSITNVADGISYPLRNVDIFGNDIFDTSDDGIEGDYGYSNVRVWQNRIHNAVHNGFSFQPQNGGPWYLIRNQIVSNKESPLKFRTTDRFVLIHNTFVNWSTISCCNDHHLLGALARNNLWISKEGGRVWGMGAATADWRTDLDHDGFDWGTHATPFTYGGASFSSVETFASASGQQWNGRRVDKAQCFEALNYPAPSPATVPPHVLTLKGSCGAIDVGAIVPNLGGEFIGAAPDLGAYEWGATPPVFGPRPVVTGNRAPEASSQTVDANEDYSVAIRLTATDADGDPLAYRVIVAPTQGALVGTAPALTYTPAADYYGADSFTFEVADPLGARSSAVVSISVAKVAVSIATASLPGGVLRAPYSAALQAREGQKAYRWGLVSGTLPPGLSLAADGVIAGTPTKAGSFSFAVRVTDARGDMATRTLGIKITRR